MLDGDLFISIKLGTSKKKIGGSTVTTLSAASLLVLDKTKAVAARTNLCLTSTRVKLPCPITLWAQN